MSPVNKQETVGQLVVEAPGRARVFERLGIDFCCGGRKPLEQACAERGLEVQTVLRELQTPQPKEEIDWSQRCMTELVDHIEGTHHAYLRQEMPRLSAMLEKVVDAHGHNHAELFVLREVYESCRAELDSHMFKEEHVLFPAIRRLESSSGEPCFHCGSLQNPIRVMEFEHDSAGSALARMRELSGGYAPPSDACNTYRALLHSLKEFEADLHVHVHKENNILFPRVIAAEKRQA